VAIGREGVLKGSLSRYANRELKDEIDQTDQSVIASKKHLGGLQRDSKRNSGNCASQHRHFKQPL